MASFRHALDELTLHLQGSDFVHSTGPVGRRQSDTIMDTDDERDHEFFFIMTFRDREQCDRAVDYIRPHEEPAESFHDAIYTMVADPIFICWEDL